MKKSKHINDIFQTKGDLDEFDQMLAREKQQQKVHAGGPGSGRYPKGTKVDDIDRPAKSLKEINKHIPHELVKGNGYYYFPDSTSAEQGVYVMNHKQLTIRDWQHEHNKKEFRDDIKAGGPGSGRYPKGSGNADTDSHVVPTKYTDTVGDMRHGLRVGGIYVMKSNENLAARIDHIVGNEVGYDIIDKEGRSIGGQNQHHLDMALKFDTSKDLSGMDVQAGGPGSGRYPKGSSGNGLGRQKTGRVFVSPNTDENTDLGYAQKALQSDRQKNFESKLKDIGSKVLGGSTAVHPAIGVWSDGAENSTELQTRSQNRDARRYAAALAGLAANQKAVLDWENDKNGPHTLYAVHANESADKLNDKIGKAGVEFRTVEASADGGSSRGYVLDQDGTMGEKLKALAAANNYRLSATKGTGDFIGSWNTRKEGADEYNKIIKDYESKHPGKAYAGGLQFSSSVPQQDETGRDLPSTGRGLRAGASSRVHRCGRVPLGEPDKIEQQLAALMEPGAFRIAASTAHSSLVLGDRVAAEAAARLRGSYDVVAWVYDHTGTPVYAFGRGAESRWE